MRKPTRTDANQRLAAPDIGVEVKNGVARLTGTVKRQSDRLTFLLGTLGVETARRRGKGARTSGTKDTDLGRIRVFAGFGGGLRGPSPGAA